MAFTYRLDIHEVNMFQDPWVIGVVGGPGAGKTAICEAVADLSQVVRVPEAPTLLGSVGLWNPVPDPQFDLDVDLFRIALERQAAWSARVRGVRMLVTDRVVGEGSYVYTGKAMPKAPTAEDCLSRYQALLLVELPPEDVWYACRGNNGSRTERAYAQAVELHERIERFVSPHPQVYRIPNTGGADGKVMAGRELIQRLVAEGAGR